MRTKTSFIFVFIIFIMAAGAAFAESPREQLKQMVEQLQQNPGDDALRVKIIKLAHTIKPAPAVLEEAERFEGRAQFAFKNAKSPADYLDAANEYEKAIAAAPWVPGYYADLCTIYEKAEKYAEAKKRCELFLASSPSAQDASDVRKRIAGLEFAIEKSSSETPDEKLLKGLDGVWYYGPEEQASPSGTRVSTYVSIKGNEAVWGARTDWSDADANMFQRAGHSVRNPQFAESVTASFVGRRVDFGSLVGELSADGKTFRIIQIVDGRETTREVLRKR